MSPDIEISVSDVRSKFAFLFSSIGELYRYFYEKKLSSKFDDVKKMTEIMVADQHLSEYLQLNIEKAFLLYPTLLPSIVAQNFRKDNHKEQDRINKIASFLDILIGDICGEINDISNEMEKYEKEAILNWLKQQY